MKAKPDMGKVIAKLKLTNYVDEPVKKLKRPGAGLRDGWRGRPARTARRLAERNGREQLGENHGPLDSERRGPSARLAPWDVRQWLGRVWTLQYPTGRVAGRHRRVASATRPASVETEASVDRPSTINFQPSTCRSIPNPAHGGGTDDGGVLRRCP